MSSVAQRGFSRARKTNKDKPGPVPWTNRPFAVEFHIKIAILSRLSLGREGVRPWNDCPQKMLVCFVFAVFFCPQFSLKEEVPGFPLSGGKELWNCLIVQVSPLLLCGGPC